MANNDVTKKVNAAVKAVNEKNTATQTETPTFQYTPSDTVTQAEAMLQQHLANKPGEYQSSWQTQLNDTLQKILNREKFSYDLNGDMLYQQYKDQYTTQGKLASMDVMGQAAAMTGGYGNSYAQTAGQQAYQGYLQQLNDRIPELYQLALNQYNAEGDEMYNQASLMAQMDEQDYGRYRDSVSDYYTDLNYLTENSRYMSETEYERAWNDFQAKYGAHRDTVADQQWQAEYDFALKQYEDSKKKTTSTTKKVKDPVDPELDPKKDPNNAAYYSDWDAGDWEGYFAKIRQSEGQAAAEEELKHFTSKGLIPTKMVNYAAIGARGGQKGH